MSTKAQRFREDEIQKKRQKGPKSQKATKKAKRAKRRVDTALPGVSATDNVIGGDHTAERNASAHAGKKAGVALEDSASGRPSRKSSRGSKNRQKASSTLEREAARRANTPQAKAARNRAKTSAKKSRR